jgi:hypothetical protein
MIILSGMFILVSSWNIMYALPEAYIGTIRKTAASTWNPQFFLIDKMLAIVETFYFTSTTWTCFCSVPLINDACCGAGSAECHNPKYKKNGCKVFHFVEELETEELIDVLPVM